MKHSRSRNSIVGGAVAKTWAKALQRDGDAAAALVRDRFAARGITF